MIVDGLRGDGAGDGQGLGDGDLRASPDCDACPIAHGEAIELCAAVGREVIALIDGDVAVRSGRVEEGRAAIGSPVACCRPGEDATGCGGAGEAGKVRGADIVNGDATAAPRGTSAEARGCICPPVRGKGADARKRPSGYIDRSPGTACPAGRLNLLSIRRDRSIVSQRAADDQTDGTTTVAADILRSRTAGA